MPRAWWLRLTGMVLAAICAGCSSAVRTDSHPPVADGAYDSEFPTTPVSADLQQIAESVRMVTAIAYYRSLTFSAEARVTEADFRNGFVTERVQKVVFMTRTSSGTAVTILARENRIALLTCDHVVRFPDTVYTHYIDQDRHKTPYLSMASIMEREEVYVAGIPGGRHLDILAADPVEDLAVLGKRYEGDMPPGVPVFQYPYGHATELKWGSFVYIFGYPSGYRMVTKAIVSSPNRNRKGGFLLDAGFKRGYSGGAVLAIRDGAPHFELVGLIRLAKGPTEVYLTPIREGEQIDFDPTMPYRGDVFVDRRSDYDYGVAEAVPAESIVEFLARHKDELHAEGYDISVNVHPAQ